MDQLPTKKLGYFEAVALGALGGSIITILLGKMIPKIMKQIMSGMMQTMMTQMETSGCTPAEM